MPAQRRAELLTFLRERGAAQISELAGALNASESTIRRDLDQLDAEGVVLRQHGGAIIPERTTFEPVFEDRCMHNPDEKRRIGQYAAKLLELNQSVLFDSSSTVFGAVAALLHRPVPITAVTNDVRLASTLATIPNVKIVMPGGEIRNGSYTLVGSTTRAFIERLHVDVALLGIHAITDSVMSEGSLEVAEIKRAMIHAAHRVVVLADHSKFGSPAFFEVEHLSVAHDLISDNSMPTDIMNVLNSLGSVRVHLV